MVIDRLIGLESHDEREEIVKSDARQRIKRMIVVSTLFVLVVMAMSQASDEPSTTSRLIEICRML